MKARAARLDKNNKEDGMPLSKPAATETDANVLERLLRARHSCRGFKADQLPDALIERMFAIAQRTASWCNSQPWKVVVTRGAETERFRQALMAHAAAHAPTPDIPYPGEYRGVYLERRRECGFQLYDSVGVPKGDKAGGMKQVFENFRLFGAPHVAIIHSDKALGPYGAVDCGAYVANLLTAAEALGLGAIAQAAVASQGALLHDHFGIPDDRQIVCGVSFGYEDKSHPANAFRTSRADLADVIDWVG